MLSQLKPSAAYTVSTEKDRYLVTLFQKDGEHHYSCAEYCGAKETRIFRVMLSVDSLPRTDNQKSHAIFAECLQAIRDAGGEITSVYPAAIKVPLSAE